MPKATSHDDSGYYVLRPDSLQVRVATMQRRRMFDMFIKEFAITDHDSILDVGVTSDRTFENSNYLENWHSAPAQITAVGMDDASFLTDQFPGMSFVLANGLSLPFRAEAFDYVHCSAVIEHVGTFSNQAELVAECARVARKGIVITTPNRWFPIEVHTSLPLFHWLPKEWHRSILRRLRYDFYADPRNLNLMSARELRRATAGHLQFVWSVRRAYLAGFASNLLLVGHRRINAPSHRQ